MKFSVKDFFSKCDQVRRKLSDSQQQQITLILQALAYIVRRNRTDESIWNFARANLDSCKSNFKISSQPG